MQQQTKSTNSGFTLVEILIIVPIVIMIIMSLIAVIIDLTGSTLVSREQLVQARDTQASLDRIGQDVRLSNLYLAQNNITISSPQGVNNTTTAFQNVGTTNGTALIIQSLTTDKNPIASDRKLIFTDRPNDCGTPLVTSNNPYYVNIVYFVKDNNLYRRTLATYNPSPRPCTTPWQLPSCATGQMNGTTCKSEDILLATGVSNFQIEYYSTASSVSPITAATSTSNNTTTRNNALVGASSVKVTISLEKTVAGRTINYSGTSRDSKLNSIQ